VSGAGGNLTCEDRSLLDVYACLFSYVSLAISAHDKRRCRQCLHSISLQVTRSGHSAHESFMQGLPLLTHPNHESSQSARPDFANVCVQFVMRHAPGARALKFVRRLPLFKGLGDNNLVSVASRMREKVYQVSTQPIPCKSLCRSCCLSVCMDVCLSGLQLCCAALQLLSYLCQSVCVLVTGSVWQCLPHRYLFGHCLVIRISGVVGASSDNLTNIPQ